MDEKYGESFFVPPVQYQIGLGTHTIGASTKNMKFEYHIQNNIIQTNVYHSFLWLVTFGSFFNWWWTTKVILFVFELTKNWWSGCQKYADYVLFVSRNKMEPVDIVQNVHKIMNQPFTSLKWIPQLNKIIVKNFPQNCSPLIHCPQMV